MVVVFNEFVVIIGLIIFIIFLLWKKWYKNINVLIFQFIMFIYIMNVINLTVFPFSFNINSGKNIWESIYLMPFENGIGLNHAFNILLAFPFGCQFPFLIKKVSNLKALSYCFLFGVIIEMTQFAIALFMGQGYSHHVIEIDDVICNFTGALLGYVLFLLFAKSFNKITQDKQLNNFWKYVRSITSLYREL